MLYLNCPKVINPSVHARYMQGAYKVHERIMQGSCKCIKGSCNVHRSRMEGLALVDMGNGAAAVVSISAKSALNWPDNAMPICCSHSNAMVSYKGGRRGRACSRRWAR